MSYNNGTTHLLGQRSFWKLDKILVKQLGLQKAFILSIVIDRSNVFLSKEMDEDGWFYITNQYFKEVVAMADKTIRDCTNEFVKLNLIEKKIVQKGTDRKNYYRLKANEIEKFINDYLNHHAK